MVFRGGLEEAVAWCLTELEVVSQDTTSGLFRIRFRSAQRLALALFSRMLTCRPCFSCGVQSLLDDVETPCLVFINIFNLKYSTLYRKRVRVQLLFTKMLKYEIESNYQYTGLIY